MTYRQLNNLLELLLTFVLLFLATALFQEAWLGFYRVILILGLCGGFSFAWFRWGKENIVIKFSLTIGALAVLGWFIYSVLHSTFLYRDVILICIKGIIFLEIILSLDLHFLSYMQLLTIPLYMCFPFFFKEGHEPFLITILFFNIVFWALLLKMKFYSFLKMPLDKLSLKRNFTVISLVVLLILSFSLGWVFYRSFRLKKMAQGGLFEVQEMDLKGSGSFLEKEYFDLQDRLLKEMGELIKETGSLEEKQQMILFLDTLVKDTPDVREVEKAAQGLISLLKVEGPGLDKSKEDVIVILMNYVEKKTAYQLKKLEDSIRSSFSKRPFEKKRAIETASLVSEIRKTQSSQEASQFTKELQEAIHDSPLEKEQSELVNELQEWKSFELSLQEPAEREAEPVEQTQEKEMEQILIMRQKKKAQSAFDKILLNVRLSPQLLFRFAGIASSLFFGLTLIGFIVLYFLTEAKKRKFMALYKNPREFIIHLYENLKVVLAILGMPSAKSMPPLHYARLIEESYPIENSSLIGFTLKFEEARYSTHALLPEDSAAALNNYKNILKAVSRHYNKYVLVLKYCSALLKQRPFYI